MNPVLDEIRQRYVRDRQYARRGTARRYDGNRGREVVPDQALSDAMTVVAVERCVSCGYVYDAMHSWANLDEADLVQVERDIANSVAYQWGRLTQCLRLE